MSEIKVPDAMRGRIRARVEEFLHGPADEIEFDATVDAFAEELARNPIVPQPEEARKIWIDTGLCNETSDEELRCIAAEWQCRMFWKEEE